MAVTGNRTAAIEEHLEVPDGRAAVNEAIDQLTAALADLRRETPGYAASIDAQLAGFLAGTAAKLAAALPPRGRRVPPSSHLVQVFRESFTRARKGELR